MESECAHSVNSQPNQQQQQQQQQQHASGQKERDRQKEEVTNDHKREDEGGEVEEGILHFMLSETGGNGEENKECTEESEVVDVVGTIEQKQSQGQGHGQRLIHEENSELKRQLHILINTISDLEESHSIKLNQMHQSHVQDLEILSLQHCKETEYLRKEVSLYSLFLSLTLLEIPLSLHLSFETLYSFIKALY
jgi:hypothetical protein